MDEDGTTKISDLGLACKVHPKLAGACGTRGYWAPDMLQRTLDNKRIPYGLAVDWFSFGCMLYEFLGGKCPFRTERAKNFGGQLKEKGHDKNYDKATLEMEPEFDGDFAEYFDEAARNLLTGLLTKDPKLRLGYNGPEEIMAHPWFETIDWGLFKVGGVPPPFTPEKDINAASQPDIGTFADTNVDLDELDIKTFEGLAWTNSSSYQTEIVKFLMFEEEMGPFKPEVVGKQSCCAIC
jgi:beta-adrenergic-receptor kinase